LISNLIIISAIGFLVGFVLSIPAGGPTSIVIISNALNGKTRKANLVNLGACLADFFYVFISIYGLTRFYKLYEPYMPYIFLAGSIFVLYTGFKTFKSKSPLDKIDDAAKTSLKVEIKSQKGFFTGLMLGFLNPGLIMSWMASTLIVLSALNSYGFDTAGLEGKSGSPFKEIYKSEIKTQDTTSKIEIDQSSEKLNHENISKTGSKSLPENYPLLLSLFYALSVAIGSVIWFYYIILAISKFRTRINPKAIHRTIQILGLVLMVFGVILGYKGISILVS
jgi:threonine/homoserine/homoserine lactone efflux protein